MPGTYERGDTDPIDRWSREQFAPENICRLAAAELVRLDDEHGESIHPMSLGIVTLDGREPASTLGREVEKAVFEECFGNDLAILRREYEAYDDRSVFIVAIDAAAQIPAGVLRLIKPSPRGLKSLNDIADPRHSWQLFAADLEARMPSPALDPAKTLDIATLAVKPEYRQDSAGQLDRISALLYYAMYQWSRQHGYDNWVGIIDTAPLKAIQGLGSPLDFFDGVEAAPYLDSPASIPFYARLDEIDRRLAEHGLDGFFLRGEGIDPSIAIGLSSSRD